MGDFQNPFRHSPKFLKYPCAMKIYFFSLQMSFYDGSNSSTFTMNAVSIVLMCKHERLTTVNI